MLSVPGNGNFSDNSLDGYIGRFTSVGVLGTGLTNPRIQKKGQYYNGVFSSRERKFCKKMPELLIFHKMLIKTKKNS